MGTARMTASPLTSPSSVSSRTCSWSCSTRRTALRSRTAVPRRPARCRATSWLPPATRQHGRRVNPPVTSVTAAAARSVAGTPWVTSIRDTYAARAAGEPGQLARTSDRGVPGRAEAAAPATTAAHCAISCCGSLPRRAAPARSRTWPSRQAAGRTHRPAPASGRIRPARTRRRVRPPSAGHQAPVPATRRGRQPGPGPPAPPPRDRPGLPGTRPAGANPAPATTTRTPAPLQRAPAWRPPGAA